MFLVVRFSEDQNSVTCRHAVDIGANQLGVLSIGGKASRNDRVQERRIERQRTTRTREIEIRSSLWNRIDEDEALCLVTFKANWRSYVSNFKPKFVSHRQCRVY